jgi:hypothetical protein
MLLQPGAGRAVIYLRAEDDPSPAALTAIGDDPDDLRGRIPGCEPGLIPIDVRHHRRQP